MRTWSISKVSFAKETCNFKEPTSRSHPQPYESDYILQKRPTFLACTDWNAYLEHIINSLIILSKEPYKRDYILQKRPTFFACTDWNAYLEHIINSLIILSKEPYERDYILQKRPTFFACNDWNAYLEHFINGLIILDPCLADFSPDDLFSCALHIHHIHIQYTSHSHHIHITYTCVCEVMCVLRVCEVCVTRVKHTHVYVM